jgi:tRNA(fMet)-specific endonuclease VapC
LEDAESVFLSSIVLGELFFGAQRSARSTENAARISEFAARGSVLACDSGTARHYGRIKSRLREVGRPIPENDIWIAATARQHGLTLVSRDAHFDEVGGLELVAW